MIRVFVLENAMYGQPLRDYIVRLGHIHNEKVHLCIEEKLPKSGLPKGYDIYSIHVSLLHSIENQLLDVRRRNPVAYIMMRNTISPIETLSPKCREAANVWVSSDIGDTLKAAFEEIVKKRRKNL